MERSERLQMPNIFHFSIIPLASSFSSWEGKKKKCCFPFTVTIGKSSEKEIDEGREKDKDPSFKGV